MTSKRFLRAVIAWCLVLGLVLPDAAVGESISQLKDRLERLKAQTASAGAAFNRAYWKLDEADVRLAKTNRRIKDTEKRLAKAKARLNRRADDMYRSGNVDTVAFILGANTFEQLITRADYLARIGKADAEVVRDVTVLRARLYKQRKTLRAERTRRASELKSLRRERDKLQANLRSKQAQFLTVKSQLNAARSGGNLPSGVSAAPGPNGMVFPVAGSYYYANTWGASRSGGRRRHQGTDIMAPTGTPCVAVLSGTVRAKEGGLGGKTIWLTADNGWQFYYAHLDTWAVKSGRVRAGQVIGTVGSTGNAAANAPHLHFQIHPGGGGPVNPYYYLRSME